MSSGWQRAGFALALLLVIGSVVFLPSIRSPFLFDDYAQSAMVDGSFPVHRAPWDLYDFVNVADRGPLMDRGVIPWWSDPHLTVRFLRPISSLLLWADHRLAGHSVLLLHLHSLAWWAAAVIAAHALFRRSLSQGAATAATALFALSPCHAMPLAWLANREALVSLALGAVALHAYLSWREGAGHGKAALAAVLFTASILAGEYGLCLGGYVLAMEIAAPRVQGTPLWRHLLGGAGRLLPFAVPAAGYLLVHRRFGYGVTGSGPYTDPLAAGSVATFLGLAPRRLGTLIVEGWLSVDDETIAWIGLRWAIVIALATLVGVVAALWRASKKLDGPRRRTLAWALVGSVLSLLPVLAVYPAQRLLGPAMIGIAAAAALIFEDAWLAIVAREKGGAVLVTHLVAIVLGFFHVLYGPAAAWSAGERVRIVGSYFAANVARLDARLEKRAATEIVVLRAMPGAFFLPFALGRRTPPVHVRVLAQANHVLALRKDARTIDLVAPPLEGIFPPGAASLFQDDHTRMAVGDVFTMPGLRATVLEQGPFPQGARSARFELDRDLESSSLLWITEDFTGFNGIALPAPGSGAPFNLF